MILKAGISLPPFLIIKDEGEVWQLATGEASVCWKSGLAGHIGDRCRQVVNFLAESIASPAVGDQPSWAHIVKGGISVVPVPPAPPPPVALLPKVSVIPRKVSRDILKAAKTALKVVPKIQVKKSTASPVLDSVDKDGQELALPPSPDMEVALEDEFEVGFSLQPGMSSVGDSAQNKKARLSQDLHISGTRDQLSTSPYLYHKVPKGSGEQQGVSAEGGGRVHTNMFGVNYVMWFDLSIEGKDPLDPAEEDWGGKGRIWIWG